MMAENIINHLKLGQIKGLISQSNRSFVQFLGIPYGNIPQRFARSSIVSKLDTTGGPSGVYDATKPGPTSIQPFRSVKSDATGNQLPTDGLPEDEDQDENCLNLTITVPSEHIDAVNDGEQKDLPVVVFLHGGAFFLGSGTRPYYNPLTFCSSALKLQSLVIFISVNYRLGALGFFHSSAASDLIPANNGLHDQLNALSWISQNISGFGGDLNNITIIGQSAGAESISLQSLTDKIDPLPYQKAIIFSGTPVTMPAKTPKEHEENFLKQAKELGIDTSGKSTTEVAHEMVKIDVSKIRDLAFVGAPCSSSTMLPYAKPTMSLARSQTQARNPTWAKSQIISGATFDGGISYIMTSNDDSRKYHAKVIINIVDDALTTSQAKTFKDIYEIDEKDQDLVALRKICQFESDIGFVNAAICLADGQRAEKTFFQLFDLGNPFEGKLEKGKFATHTWDIVALLGAFEDRLSEEYKAVIGTWREKIIRYICYGEDVCGEWKEGKGEALIVGNESVRADARFWESETGERLQRLRKLGNDIDVENGWDFLWEGVGRRFLMEGK